MKVLHIIPSVAPSRGGPSQAIIQMVVAQRAIGMDAQIATTNDDSSVTLDVETNKFIDHKGAPTIFFERYSPQVPAIREFSYSSKFAKWLRDNIESYDIVHVHAIFSFCSSYAMNLARLKKVPYVVRPIGQLEKWSLSQSRLKKKVYLWLIEKRSILNASAVHFTSATERNQALELFPDLNTSVIPLGISHPRLIEGARAKICSRYKLDKTLPILLFMGRLHPKKGLEILIQALAQTASPFQLLIAGSGDLSYTKQLVELIKKNNLAEHSSFLGFVSGEEKSQLLQGSDLFVLTSHSENFGVAVLEAMINGTAPLITEGVALSKQIAQSQTGWVCEIEPDRIAEKITDALSDKKVLSIRGQLARDYAMQHYQWDTISQNLKALYAELV